MSKAKPITVITHLFVGGEYDRWLSSAFRSSGVAYEFIGRKANKMIGEYSAVAYEAMRPA